MERVEKVSEKMRLTCTRVEQKEGALYFKRLELKKKERKRKERIVEKGKIG